MTTSEDITKHPIPPPWTELPDDESDYPPVEVMEEPLKTPEGFDPEFWRGRQDKLRAVGFDDRAILQITMIAAWFNYINRVADALGVGR